MARKSSPRTQIRKRLLESSRGYSWKDGDIARRFAEDVFALAEEYGKDDTIFALKSLQQDWIKDSICLDEAMANYGVGLDFWFNDVGIITPTALLARSGY